MTRTDAMRKRIEAIRQESRDLASRAALKSALADEMESLMKTPEFSDCDAGAFALAPVGSAVRMTIPGSIASQAESVIRERGKPMRARDIAKVLEERGVVTHSKTPVLSLLISAMRRRKDLFGKKGRGIYALVEKDKVIAQETK